MRGAHVVFLANFRSSNMDVANKNKCLCTTYYSKKKLNVVTIRIYEGRLENT